MSKSTDRHPGLLDAAAFAWYGVQPPNVAVKHDGRIFRNLNQYRLPGVRLPNRSCRRDVACVIAADLLTQIAWMPCVVLLSIGFGTGRVGQYSAQQPPVFDT